MASQMVIPASKDTLFMRGFSARTEVDHIRDFFSRDGGRCTVEFFKVSEDQTRLFLALKFHGKDIAKEILNKYDNTEVLGHRITISWFKDIRKAKMKAAGGRSGGWHNRWSPDRYDHRNSRYQHNRNWGNFGTRGRKYDRSPTESRSRSPSRSRSRSRSRSISPRSRSPRSPSPDSPRVQKHRRNRNTSDTRRDRRSSEKPKSRRDRDRSPSIERSNRDREESVGLEPDEIPASRVTKHHSKERSPQRNIKVIRSTVSTVERSAPGESNSEDDDSDAPVDEYGRQPISEDELDKLSTSNLSSKDDSSPHKASPSKPPPREKPSREASEQRVRDLKDETPPQEEKKVFTSKERGGFRDQDNGMVDRKAEEEVYYNRGRRYEQEMSPPPPPPPPERQPQQARHGDAYDKPMRDQNYVPHNKRSRSPIERANDPLPPVREKPRVLPPGGDSPQHARDRNMGYGFHGNRDTNRGGPHYDDGPRDMRGESPLPVARGHLMNDPRDIRTPPEQSPDPRFRGKRSYEEDNMPMYERKIPRDFEDRPPIRRDPQDDYIDTKRRRYIDDNGPPPVREMRRDYYDDHGRMERPNQGPPMSRGPMPADRERSPYYDDRNIPSRPSGGAFNGGMVREMEKGALGLPPDKMMLVREKKDEIEKSYRQDCETFAAVAKMLISKDSGLEDRLQASVRENLKDIGQRCIHELREFIEQLKGDDDGIH